MPETLIHSQFQQHFPQFEIKRIQSVFGGSINKNYLIFTQSDVFFVKLMQSAKATDIHESEKKGLEILKSKIRDNTVEVIKHIKAQGYSLLIEKGYELSDVENSKYTNCAEILAQLHQNKNEQFGLEFDNYIGFLPQKNDFKRSWSEFFYSNRIEPQIAMARNQEFISKKECVTAEALAYRLPDIFPDEQPALLHGDFWSGNFKQHNSQILFFDPAVYYGHREMDIAMTFMFDKLPDNFYNTYNNLYPLEKNWKDRIEICNLYTNLVHLNLFGESYLVYVKDTLKPFIN